MSKKLLWGVLSILLVLSLFTSCSTVSNVVDKVQGNNIATVTGMVIGIRGWGMYNKDGLYVQLKPTNAKANVNYAAMLYEKGKDLSEGCGVSWNQAEINIKTVKTVYFPLSQEELNAYQLPSNQDANWWKSIYSIKIIQ